MTTTVKATDLAISTAISAGSPAWRNDITPATFRPKYDILIYGATSFTAKIMIDYLCTHPQAAEFSFVLGGRTEKKMRELQAELKRKGYGKKDITVFSLVDSGDQVKAAEEAVGSSKVVINLAGPYDQHNAEMLVRECAKQGRHYVDLNAETHWLKEMILKYDFLASTTGSCIVPSCGYDSIPGDLTTYLSARYLSESAASGGPPGNDAKIASSESYYTLRGAISGGTLNTIFNFFEVDKARLRRAASPFSLAIARSAGNAKGAVRLSYNNVATGLHGTLFLMAPHNMRIVYRSWSLFSRESSLLVASSRKFSSKAKPSVRYGDRYTYREALNFSRKRGGNMSVMATWLCGLFLAAVGGVLYSSSMLRGFIRRLLPDTGAGPSEKVQKSGWFETINVSATENDRVAVTTMYGEGDPGYNATARMLAECALSLAISHDSLPPLAHVGGVLTTATALGDVLVSRLEKFARVSMVTQSLVEWKRDRAETKKNV